MKIIMKIMKVSNSLIFMSEPEPAPPAGKLADGETDGALCVCVCVCVC
jgi:hypothetical protein